MSNTERANNPAIDALATVTKKGLKLITAKRVAGKDPLNINTPINPLIQPVEIFLGDLFITFKNKQRNVESDNNKLFFINRFHHLKDNTLPKIKCPGVLRFLQQNLI